MTGAGDLLGVRPFAEIARGPVASVYKAYDAEAGTVVLLKALRPAATADPERRARFDAEARLASTVEHPNVVRVLRVSPDALVAEWVEGRDLETLLDERGALPAGLAAVVVREAARGLAAVHAAGILHRDVKPANVLIGDDGAVRLTDFGLASLTTDTTDGALSHEVRGTLSTLAPEIVRGDAAGPASDVFSLGAVLAHALTGRAPFDAATASATLDAVLHADVGAALATDPRVPDALARIASAALSRDPTERLTADALARSLEDLIAVETGPESVSAWLAGAEAPALVSPRPASPAPTPAPTVRSALRPARRAPWHRWALAAGVLVAGAVAFAWSRPTPPQDPPPEPAASEPVVIRADPASTRENLDATPSEAAPTGASPEAGTEGSAATPEAAPLADRPPPRDRARTNPSTTDRASRAQSPPARAEPPPAPPPSSTPAPAASQTAVDARPGTLVVAAEPWATVRADGRDLGTTPVRTALPPGTYRLTFQNPGFPSHTRTVEVNPAETTRTELSLWSLVARVTLDVAPWAEVWVDGALWDTVPPQARPLVLTPGTHTLRFEHPTLGRQEQSLRVAAGESRTVRVRMTDAAP